MTEETLTREQEIEERLAYKTERIKEYLENGEISSSLTLTATLAMAHAEHGWNRIVPAYAKFDQKWIKVLSRIHAEYEDICFKGKEFELKHWMGFCPDDVTALMKLNREWEHCDWASLTKEREELMYGLWNPHPVGVKDLDTYWQKHWQPYIDRRDKTPLQETFSKCVSSISADLPKMSVLMGSSGGRVLLTLSDQFPKGHSEGIYGGAWVSLIFDEKAEYPRSGVQGQCATRDEAIDLIQAVIDNMPKLTQNDNISFA